MMWTRNISNRFNTLFNSCLLTFYRTLFNKIIERSGEMESSNSQNRSKSKEMFMNYDKFRLINMSNISISSIHEEEMNNPPTEE